MVLPTEGTTRKGEQTITKTAPANKKERSSVTAKSELENASNIRKEPISFPLEAHLETWRS